jgi:3D (Asp-Asp-Asp) domain-containing protein
MMRREDNKLTKNDFNIGCPGHPLLSFQEPYGASTRAVKGKVILLATAVVIEGEDRVGRGFEIISTDTGTWITLSVDGSELAAAVIQDPYGARARTVEGKIIKLATMVIIEGKGTIGSGFKIVPSNA